MLIAHKVRNTCFLFASFHSYGNITSVMKTPTIKVAHTTTNSVIYKNFHISVDNVKRKLSKGATLKYFPCTIGCANNSFFSLNELDSKGRTNAWYLEPSPELHKLEHSVASV